jgi:hypothetical protein
MSTKTILSVFLAASLAGNASFLSTTLFKRFSQRAGALNQLALTADQNAKFAASKRAFLEQRAQAHQHMATLRGVLADEFGKEVPDRQRLIATTAEMAETQTNMRPKVIDHLLSLHTLLTPAQRTAFANLMRAGDGSAGACPGAMLYPTRDDER